jgi:hypothetical protein
MFERLTKALATDEESKPLVVLDISKCDNGAYFQPATIFPI